MSIAKYVGRIAYSLVPLYTSYIEVDWVINGRSCSDGALNMNIGIMVAMMNEKSWGLMVCLSWSMTR